MCSKYETDREKILTFKSLANSSHTDQTIDPEAMKDFKEVNYYRILFTFFFIMDGLLLISLISFIDQPTCHRKNGALLDAL